MRIWIRSMHKILRKRWLSQRVEFSLFNPPRPDPPAAILRELGAIFRHPIRSLLDELPGTRGNISLFHHDERMWKAGSVNWKRLLSGLITDYRFAIFIPSIWSDQRLLAEGRMEMRTRRMEAGVASMVLHAAVLCLAVFFGFHRLAELPQPRTPVVFISAPMFLPFGGMDLGGGGGGGGKREVLPASGGRLPEAAAVQLMPPDPGMPKPLMPDPDSFLIKPSVQMQIDLPADPMLPIGDITAPPGGAPSSGPGSGDGIGAGRGTGVGPGNGPGAGPGENGGYGGGSEGTVRFGPDGSGNPADLKPPEILFKPSPNYTEDARRVRLEGIVVLQVTIRANGTVDSFRVVRGLGHGLDESAIHTISAQWKFKPATYRGTAIDFPASIEVSFHLY